MLSSKRIAMVLTMVILPSGCLYATWLQSGSSVKKQPNIVVIMADDLGWNDVSFHGGNEIPTPNIDSLAYNGVILQRHYVLPICTPSRTAFLTGRYPIRTGMQGYPLKAGEPRAIPLNNTLLPEYLKQLGYSTHIVGKWHVGYYTDRHIPTYRGFDTFFGYYNGYITYFNHTMIQQSHVGYDLHYDDINGRSVKYNNRYMTDLITERAQELIRNHDKTKPLYLQVSHLAAHSSDAEETMEVPDIKEMNKSLGYIEDYNRRKLAGVVTSLDESVGKVVRSLETANMLENSIIIFLSDNGAQTEGMLQNYGSNYPLRGLKFTLFEGGVRGVACIYSPLIKKPSRISNQLIHITDWLPTFYSIAGGNLKDLGDNFDGVDQWNTISFDGETNRKSVLLNIDEIENLSGAIIGKYKLINGAKKVYGDYYGDSGRNYNYPKYDIKNILQSPTGSAISNINNVTLNPEIAIQLRKAATVLCNNFTSYPNCSDSCLFDVYDDPCETNDLSSEYPQIVADLKRFVQEYYGVLMRQTNTMVDPDSFPEHFNGTWMPWKKLSKNEIQLLHFSLSNELA